AERLGAGDRELTEDLRPRPVRRYALPGGTTAPHHLLEQVAEVRGDLLDELGLADAHLPQHGGEMAAAVQRVQDVRAEQGTLACPPHEQFPGAAGDAGYECSGRGCGCVGAPGLRVTVGGFC